VDVERRSTQWELSFISAASAVRTATWNVAPNPIPTYRVIPAKAGIQAALRTSSDSALESRLRGNDGVQNGTSVHVTFLVPPMT